MIVGQVTVGVDVGSQMPSYINVGIYLEKSFKHPSPRLQKAASGLLENNTLITL